MDRQPVESKALRAVGYDPATQELELEFTSGHVYAYRGVPASVVEWLRRTSNKGRYVQHHLTGRYGEQRIHSRGPAPTPPEELEAALLASLQRQSPEGR